MRRKKKKMIKVIIKNVSRDNFDNQFALTKI